MALCFSAWQLKVLRANKQTAPVMIVTPLESERAELCWIYSAPAAAQTPDQLFNDCFKCLSSGSENSSWIVIKL